MEQDNNENNNFPQDPIESVSQQYGTPLLRYLYYVMGEIAFSAQTLGMSTMEAITSQMPLKYGTFKQVRRAMRSSNGAMDPFSADHMISEQDQRHYLMDRATDKCENKWGPRPPTVKDAKHKIDGAMIIVGQFMYEFNQYIHQMQNVKDCQIHAKFWHDGICEVKDDEHDNDDGKFDYEDDGDIDDDDDVEDDDYNEDVHSNHIPQAQKHGDSASRVRDICNLYRCVDIEKLFEENEKKLGVKKIERKLVQKKDPDDEKGNNQMVKPSNNDPDEFEDYVKKWEEMEDFVKRLFQTFEPKNGSAMMLLVDFRNSPDITVYVWYKQLLQKNCDDIGILREECRKQKYFEMDYNGKAVNIGNYVGLLTFILNTGDIHQFLSVFDGESYFNPLDVVDSKNRGKEALPAYYTNLSLYERIVPLHNANDDEKSKKIAKLLNKFDTDLFDKLNKRESKFKMDIFNKIEKEIRKMDKTNDDDSKADGDDDDDDDLPNVNELNTYGPWVFHKTKARMAQSLKRAPKVLSPKEYRIFKADATAQTKEEHREAVDEIV